MHRLEAELRRQSNEFEQKKAENEAMRNQYDEMLEKNKKLV